MHESKFIGFGEGSSWGEFLRPQGVTHYGSNVFCADSRNNRISCFDTKNETFSYIGKDTVEMDRPAGIAALGNYLSIVDFGNNRVHVCQSSQVSDKHPDKWQHVLSFGSEGSGIGEFCRPWGVAMAKLSDMATYRDPWANHIDLSTSVISPSSTEWPQSSTTTTTNDLLRSQCRITHDKSATLTGFNATEATGNSLIIRQTSNNTNQDILSTAWSNYLIVVADRSNNRIQAFKFNATGQTVTFSHMFGDGPGTRHGQFDRPAGVVINPNLEHIIVTDKDNHRVQVFNISGTYLFKFGERGSKCGQFSYPWDVDVCKSTHNIIVSDTRNRRVQIFNGSGRFLMHFGNPLDSPRGVVYLSPAEILVSDFNKHRLIKIIHQSDEKTISSSTIKHHDSMINNNFNRSSIHQIDGILNANTPPTQLSDYLMFNSFNNNNLPQQQRLNRSSQIGMNLQPMHESKFIGFGEGSSWGEFLRPQGVTHYGSNIFCADSRNNRISCFDKTTETFSYIGKETVEMDRPAGIAALGNYLSIVDFGNNRVHVCQSSQVSDKHPDKWQHVLSFGSEGSGIGEFCRPWGVAMVKLSDMATYRDPWANYIDLSTSVSTPSSTEWPQSSTTTSTNNIFSSQCRITHDKSATLTGFNATESTGNSLIIRQTSNNTNQDILSTAWSNYLIVVADRSNNRIQAFKFNATGQTVTFSHMFGDGPGTRHGQFDRPAGVVINPNLEHIIVTDKDNHRVQVFNISGTYLFKFGERGSKCGQFSYPWDVDVCKSTHNIIVSDTRNRRVQIFNGSGRFLMHFGNPLDSPRGVVYLSPAEILVSDFNKHRLIKIIHQSDEKTISSSTIINHHGSINNNNYNNNQNSNKSGIHHTEGMLSTNTPPTQLSDYLMFSSFNENNNLPQQQRLVVGDLNLPTTFSRSQ